MFRNSLKAGLRNFWKNKSYSFLNILGLAIGIACAGLIFLWVEDETGFDRVHVKKDRLYMVLNNWPFSQHFSTYESTPGLMGPAIKKEIPGVVNTCRSTEGNSTQLIVIGNKSVYSNGTYADSSLFSMSRRMVCDAYMAAELCLSYNDQLVGIYSGRRNFTVDCADYHQLSDHPGGHIKSDQ